MNKDQDQLTLELLPDQVLLDIAAFLEPWPRAYSNWVAPLYFEKVTCAIDVVSLSNGSKRLRYALQPIVFRTLTLGDLRPRKGGIAEGSVQRIKDIERDGQSLLRNVRLVSLYATNPKGVMLVKKCLERMPKLVSVSYNIPASIPAIWIDAFQKLPDFHTLEMTLGSVESLPTILPLASRLRGLRLGAFRHAVPFPSLLKLCPITVASRRRSRLPMSFKNVATVDEHLSAWDTGLAKLLLAAKDSLAWLSLDPRLSVDDPPSTQEEQYLSRLFNEMKRLTKTKTFPTFPRLERMSLRSSTHKAVVRHILNTSPDLNTMDVMEWQSLEAPPRELINLRTFHYLFDENMIVAPSVRAFIRGSTLQNLGLNGIQGADLASLFNPPPTELRHLRKLHVLVHAIGPLTESAINAMVEACPDLVRLSITSGCWSLEADWLLNKIGDSLPHLLTFCFDHPYEHPRVSPFLYYPDGETIRSERRGHFVVVTTRGNTPEEEITRRIREDLTAVTPKYRRRFGGLAKRTRIELIEWHATDEVIWSWRFEHVGSEVSISEEAKITLQTVETEAPTPDTADNEARGGGTVWMTGPRVRG